MGARMKPVLEVQNLEVIFTQEKEEKKVVDCVSFAVAPGEILSIVGESGCGKSVSMLSVMGLLGGSGKVAGGSILFDGVNLLELSEPKLDHIRGNSMSMIFQDALTSLNPVFTIGNQMIETMMRHKKINKKEARELAIQMLAKVGMPNPMSIMKQYPHTLSGGMRQRVMIGMALCCNPQLLIADEPTTALDVTVQAQIMNLLRELQKEIGMSIILITHDLGVVAEMADRVLVMYAGQIVEEGTVEKLFEQPLHPYSSALLSAIPNMKKDKLNLLTSIEGTVPEEYDRISGCRFANRCSRMEDKCKEVQHNILLDKQRSARCWKATHMYRKNVE